MQYFNLTYFHVFWLLNWFLNCPLLFDLGQNKHGMQNYSPSNVHFRSAPVHFDGHMRQASNDVVGHDNGLRHFLCFRTDSFRCCIGENTEKMCFESF